MEAATPNGNEDAKAIELAMRGDDDAWHSLVQQHQVHIYRLAFRITFNEDDALDAVQETFLKVAKSLSKFNRGSSFRAWVTTIVLREAINICRKRTRTPQPVADEILHVTLQADTEGSLTMDPGEILDHKRQIQQVQIAMAELSPQQRAILLLGISNDLGPAEVARELQLPANQVRSQWSRAVAKLRILLKNDTSTSTRTAEQGARVEQ